MNKKTRKLSRFLILTIMLLTAIIFPQFSAAGQNLVAKEVIEINTKADLIALLNRVHPSSSGVPGDQKRYGIIDSTINLNADIEISSDDINSQIPENTLYTKYEHAFKMENSSFLGNGHTITITQGTRRIYPLFGELRVSGADTGFVAQVERLSLVYKGNVYGSGFARMITQAWFGNTNHRIQQINITVEGSILPISEKFWTQNLNSENTQAKAAGFAEYVDGAEIKDVNITVAGDIGTLTPEKQEHAQTELIYGRSSGFILARNSRASNAALQPIDNLNISVAGSILGGSKHFKAEALGLGYDLQEKKFTNVTLNVVKDIKVVADGDSLFTTPYSYLHDPHIASAVGHDLHHIENSTIHIGGDISAANNSNVGMKTNATGIGDWDYLNDLTDPVLQQNPLTINNLTLTVGGSVKATSTAPQYETDATGIVTRASSGFSNNINSGFENYEYFQGNTIKILGDVIADSQEGFSVAELWGYFTGAGNDFSAKSVRAVSQKGTTIAAPFYHFLNGKNNTVTLTDGVFSQGAKAYVGGWAYIATQMDNLVDKNVMNVKNVISDGTYGAGGFAYQITTHKNQPDVIAEIKNTNIVLDKFEQGTTIESAYVGGFVAYNRGTIADSSTKIPGIALIGVKSFVGGFVGYNLGPITSSTADSGPITITGFGDTGGFVGYNGAFPIENSVANITSISVNGDPQRIAENHQNIGGFAGRVSGGMTTGSAAFVRDSITASSGNYVNLGGFIGIGTDIAQSGNSAQVGENLISIENIGVVNIGGYAGRIIASANGNASVDTATALIFGKIEGRTEKTDFPSFSAGGIGVLQGQPNSAGAAVLKDSASYVGGEIIAGNFTPFGGENPVAGAVGNLIYGTLFGYTVLSDYLEAGIPNRVYPLTYVANVVEPTDFTNNFFVEVNGAARTVVPVTLNAAGEFEQGAILGTIGIAPRVFQNNYWGASADDPLNTYPYANFDYVSVNEAGIAFNLISRDSNIAAADATQATLNDFVHRHLSIWAGNNTTPAPIYDILGIKAGDFFSLTYESNGGTVYPAEMYLQGTEVTLDKVPVRDGFNFDGWYAESELTTKLTTVIINGNTTVYAKWSSIPSATATQTATQTATVTQIPTTTQIPTDPVITLIPVTKPTMIPGVLPNTGFPTGRKP